MNNIYSILLLSLAAGIYAPHAHASGQSGEIDKKSLSSLSQPTSPTNASHSPSSTPTRRVTAGLNLKPMLHTPMMPLALPPAEPARASAFSHFKPLRQKPVAQKAQPAATTAGAAPASIDLNDMAILVDHLNVEDRGLTLRAQIAQLETDHHEQNIVITRQVTQINMLRDQHAALYNKNQALTAKCAEHLATIAQLNKMLAEKGVALQNLEMQVATLQKASTNAAAAAAQAPRPILRKLKLPLSSAAPTPAAGTAAPPNTQRLMGVTATQATISFGTSATGYKAKATISLDQTTQEMLLKLASTTQALLQQDPTQQTFMRALISWPDNQLQIILPEEWQRQSPANMATQISEAEHMQKFFTTLFHEDYQKKLERYLKGATPVLVPDSPRSDDGN